LVDVGGVAGDRQGDPRVHGGPERALCLWSFDVIDALRAEGHPIEAGAAGENVTVQGIDWSSVAPGTRLRLGDDVEAEVTRYTSPCHKNARWFRGGDYRRMSQEDHPGWSRVYARVVAGGVIHTGDPVTLAAPSAGRPPRSRCG